MVRLATRETAIRNGFRIELWDGEVPLRFRDVVEKWQRDDEFIRWFDRLLGDAAFDSFRWETPPVTAYNLDRAFEFTLIDAPELNQPPEWSSFAEQLKSHLEPDAISFANLGGDAILVIPRPTGASSDYGHLAAFVRAAPQSQKRGFWNAVGSAMARRVGMRPVWLSTAGAGVPWLHVRLDDRPKYYHHAPYRQAPPVDG